MLSLLDVEPLSPAEIGQKATELLEKLNKVGVTKLTADEELELRLIRSYFE